LFKSFSRRGVVAATMMLFTLVGGSSQAFGHSGAALPAVSTLVTSQPITDLVRVLTPAPVVAMVKPSLDQLVAKYSVGPDLDEQQYCLANAVYFESNGEPLEGQLAVAKVVINRAASGIYPTSLCGVIKQKAQFSFVRAGHFPHIPAGCAAWRKAQAIARIAMANVSEMLPTDVLWYHADYVAPKWRTSLIRVEKIGAHIFYRA
jgi:hypothetical protein